MDREVKFISERIAQRVIAMRRPLGRFIQPDYNKSRFVAIDNSTGDAWTEEFATMGDAKAWLEVST